MDYVTMKISWVPRNIKQYRIISQYFNPFFSELEYLQDDTIFCCEVASQEQPSALSIVKFYSNLKRVTLLYTVVFPEFRSQGINTQIKKFVEAFALDMGAEHLWGHVRENNIASLNSLLKSGFVIVDEGIQFYKNGDRKLTVKKELFSTSIEE